MNKKRFMLILALLLVIVTPPFHTAKGLGGVTLTAPTRSNVTIDGTLSPSEWSDATHLSFNWAFNNASLTGGGDVWVKTNGTDLLIAVGANGRTTVNAGIDSYSYTLNLLFDNDNSGVVNNNEDAKSLGIAFTSPSTATQTYNDLHYSTSQGRYVGDTYVNGTAAGANANPGGSGGWSWEFAIPLKSNLAEDFTLNENASIGFEVVYAENHYRNLSLISSTWAQWADYYSTGLPTGSSPDAYGWATIVWTNLQAPISDTTPPTIATPTIQPASPGSGDTVTVRVNVTDTGSGVKNVSITYTTDNWKSTNKTLLASYNITTHIAMAQIPGLQFGGHVAYYVVAFDNAGNRAVNNNSGSYFGYDVSGLYTYLWLFILPPLAIIVGIFALYYLRRKPQKNPSQTSAT